MANNRIQIKRTSVSGRTANTTAPSNSQYIAAGELAINMPDSILYSSNGSALITVGSNLVNQRITNAINVDNSKQINFRTVNAAAFTYFTQQNDDNFVFYSTNTAYGARAVWGVFANSTTSNLQVYIPLQLNSGLVANGSIGSPGQTLASNGSAVYWSTVAGTGTVTQVDTGNGLTGGPITGSGTVSVNANNGIIANSSGLYVKAGDNIVVNSSGVHASAGVNTAAQYTFTNTVSFTQTINGTANNSLYLGGKVEGDLNVNSALVSNNTNFIGTVSAANVVSNAQLSGNLANYTTTTALTNNLANYQTTAGLSANVATLTANNTSFVGSVSAANVVSNAQLSANLANYVTATNLTNNLANYQTTAGLSANVATLTANNTSFVGSVSAANVVSNAQLSANLSNYAALAGASFTGNVSVSANLVVSNAAIRVGNSTVNSTVNSTAFRVGNSVYSVTADQFGVRAGNSIFYTDYSQSSVNRLYSPNASYSITRNDASSTTDISSYYEVYSGAAIQTLYQFNQDANKVSMDFINTDTGISLVSNATQAQISLQSGVSTAIINSTAFSGTAANASLLNNKTEGNLNVNSSVFSTNSINANNADYLDGQHGAYYAANSQLANYALLSGASFTGNVTANNANTLYNLNVGGNLTVAGNLTVTGNVTTIGANNLSIVDNFIYLNSNNTTQNEDIGIAGNYNDGTYAHTGIFRDATDGYWKVFDGYTPEPDSNVNIDTSNTTFNIAGFWANNIRLGNTTVYSTANSTVFSGTANNTSFVGTVSAANVVSNAQLSGNLANYVTTTNLTNNLANYQTTAGLSANVATLTANNANFVRANSGITSNSSGVFVTQGTGTVVNATGVHVNATYIGTLSANNATYLNGQLAAYYTNATNITTGTLPYAQIPANVINTTANFTITGVHTYNANLVLGSGLSANGGFGTAGQVLHSNGTATYWAADDNSGGTVTSVAAGTGLSGGTITTTGTLAVNAAYIATISANNATYLNGQPASYYTNASNITTGTLPYAQIPANIINTTAAFTISGVHTYNANIVVGTAAGLSANGGFGTAGEVLHSNGTSVYWAADDQGQGVTSVAAGTGLSGGTITTTGTLAVNAAYIATISANNSTYFGGYTWAAPAVLGSTTANGASLTYANVSGQVNAASLLLSTNTATIGTGTYFVSNGNVGVGTSTPSDKFQIAHTGSVDFSARVDSATAGDRPSFRFIHTGGNLTTQSPASSRLGLVSFLGVNDSSALTTYSFFDSFLDGTANSTANSYIRFQTTALGTSAERFRVTSSGVTVTGSMAATTGTFSGTVTVSSNNATGGGIILSDDGDIVDLNDGYCSMRFSSGVRVYSGNKTGSVVITLSNGGAITASGDITAFSSDGRLKTDIVPISNALEKVSKIRGVHYRHNELAKSYGFEDKAYVGVIAQELEAVLPEVVAPAPFDDDGKGNSKSGENYMTVKYEKIVPLLIEAIKELSTQVDELKKKLGE